MHGAALRYLGLEGEYRLLDVLDADLEKTVRALPSQGFTGFNVTIPHKERVFTLCNHLSETARLAGAVNTVVLENNEIKGDNTDAGGLRDALLGESYVSNSGTALVIGAGGAARAALIALDDLGVTKIYVAARNTDKARPLSHLLDQKQMSRARVSILTPEELLSSAETRFELIVNCTPIGQSSQAIPPLITLLFKSIGPDAFFFDMVYERVGKKTPLIKLADDVGMRSADGLMMLVNQAALAFKVFTDFDVPPEVMLSAIKDI